jgi:hypothetical protein
MEIFEKSMSYVLSIVRYLHLADRHPTALRFITELLPMITETKSQICASYRGVDVKPRETDKGLTVMGYVAISTGKFLICLEELVLTVFRI